MAQDEDAIDAMRRELIALQEKLKEANRARQQFEEYGNDMRDLAHKEGRSAADTRMELQQEQATRQLAELEHLRSVLAALTPKEPHGPIACAKCGAEIADGIMAALDKAITDRDDALKRLKEVERVLKHMGTQLERSVALGRAELVKGLLHRLPRADVETIAACLEEIERELTDGGRHDDCFCG